MEITISKINQFKSKKTFWIDILFKQTEKEPFQSGSLKVAIPHDENMTIKEIESAAKAEAFKLIKSLNVHLDQP